MNTTRRPFGQRLEVSVALRKLIRDYPGDVGIFKELIQNADDGGAREILLFLDPREQGEMSVPLPGMQILSGPAIISSNDKPFTSEDLENIQRLADSEKIEAAGKTGRFGLGFNSVYNITDFPLLLTGDNLCLFDPCAAIVEPGRSGDMWSLNDEILATTSFLDLFTPGGFSGEAHNHSGTIFRFPLRNSAHLEKTRGKISDLVFGPEFFDTLVAGLAEIADSLLLFLKHIEFIGCYRVDPKTSKRVPLLEIETLNSEVVQAGREKVNQVLIGTVDGALEMVASAPGGRITTSFIHEIAVTEGQKSARPMKWRVTTGLYAGDEGRLVDQARALRRHHEKAIPSAGVAVCLERSAARVPSINGQACCFLPLGSKPGAFPVQLHGAFDIDSSRSDLTPHTAGEDERKQLRGLWNELLVEDGLAEAYREALELVRASDLEQPAKNGEAEAFYSIFPRHADVIDGPLAKLFSSVYAKIAPLPFFRAADDIWYPATELVRPPDNQPHLEACLIAEGFKIPQPKIPNEIVDGLGGNAPPILEASNVREHFHTDEDIGLPLQEVPYPGLKIRAQLEAVVSFLANDATFDEWTGLPFALCADGKLHTFGSGNPETLFLGTARQREIFASYPGWFLDDTFANTTSLASRPVTGIERMTAVQITQLVDRLTGGSPNEDPAWNPDGSKPPNRQWLVKVFLELNSAQAQDRPEKEFTDAAHLVPGSDERLHTPGSAKTPLLVGISQRTLCRILREVGVPHFQLGEDALSKQLELFASIYDELWRLTPKDLADSLISEVASLAARQDAWARPEIVKPLLRFLSSTEGLEQLRESPERIDGLRRIPLFEDQNRTFAGIDGSCFLPGEFSSRELPLGIRLLQESGWRGLLELLGVTPLDRRTLLRDHLLTSYGSKVEAEQRTLLKWIRDEWSHVLDECESEGERDELSDLLEQTPLVRTTNGSLSPIPEIYDPEHQELIRSVLGEEAAFPDPSFYLDQKDIWLRFFRSFQLATTPRPQDLADFIAGLSEAASDHRLTGSEARKVELFLAHITEHWESLREQTVSDGDGNEVSFSSYLSTLAWCPVVRDLDRLQQFGASVAPEERLFTPSEIFLAEQGNLVASQAALLKQGRRPLSGEMRKDLGFREQPDAEIVIAHLQVLLKPYGTRELNEAEHKRVQNPARVILEYFGRLDLDDEAIAASANKAFNTLRELPCVYHPERRRFYRPCDLFRSAPVCLAPWKITYLPGGNTKAWLSDAVDRLGRRERPGVQDHIEALRGIASRVPDGAKLDETDVLKFLAVQAAMTALLSDDADLDECPVLDRYGCVAKPEEVLHLDDAWLEASMRAGVSLRLLHQNTPDPLIEHLGIARVSRLLKKVIACHLEESQMPGFANECSRLEEVFTHDDFCNGFRRIATRDYGTEGADIKLPENIELKPIVSLRCANRVEFNGSVFDLAETDEDFCLDPSDGSCVIWLAESARPDLPDRLALALNELLPPEQQIDRGDLAVILRCPTNQISRQLDRRRIPPLGQAEFDFEKGAGPGREIEFEESSEDFDAERHDNNETESERDTEDLTQGPESRAKDETDEADDGSDVEVEDETEEGAGTAEEETQVGAGRTGGGGGGGRGRGERRGRMLPGKGSGSGSGKPLHHTAPKRQDDLWISRPKTEKQAIQEQRNGDAGDDEVPINHRVGSAAVGWVLQYERSQGRRPQNMAHANPGYDIESRQGRVVERYIEVKGINGEWGKNGVPISAIQFEKGRELGELFWLYVVEHALDPEQIRIHTIQNPVEKISQFRFDFGWRECGEPVSFRALEPKVGMKLFIEGEGEGEILHANQSGSTWHLKARFDENSPSKNLIYNPVYMQLVATDESDD